MRKATISAVFGLAAALGLAAASAAGPVGTGDFDARQMLRGPVVGDGSSSSASLSLNGSGRFSMRQSYSLSAVSGGGGSASSGLYLNTLSYQFSPLLTASLDVGFHTPLHSSMPGASPGAGAGSIVVPRLGLEYRPTDRLSFNLEVVNAPDAWKAYGGPWSPHFYQGSRTP